MKSLEALDWLKYNVVNYDDAIDKIVLIETELKALEIIKEKMVDVVYLYGSCYELEHYNEYAPFEIEEEDKLTQEEFDLLKEVFCK